MSRKQYNQWFLLPAAANLAARSDTVLHTSRII